MVGKSPLSEADQIKLEVATLIKDDFFQQNLYTDSDSFCPLYKTFGIMKNLMHFYELVMNAVTSTASSDNKITWGIIKEQMWDNLLYRKSLFERFVFCIIFHYFSFEIYDIK